MAKLPPPSGVARLTFTGQNDGVPNIANVYHVRCAGGGGLDVDELLELLDDLISAFDGSGFYDQMIGDAEMNHARLMMSNGTTTTPVETAVSTLAGTGTGEHVAGSSAIVVSWKGSWSYRGGKPRTYVPALDDEAFQTPITLTAAIVTAQRAAALELIANVLALSGAYGSDVELGALIGNTPSSAGTFYPFTTALVTNQIGTIRARAKA